MTLAGALITAALLASPGARADKERSFGEFKLELRDRQAPKPAKAPGEVGPVVSVFAGAALGLWLVVWTIGLVHFLRKAPLHGRAYRRCRKRFEAKRQEWLASHRGEFVVIGEGLPEHFVSERKAVPFLVARPGEGLEFAFRLDTKEEEAERLRHNGSSTWTYVSEPFLDTETDLWLNDILLYQRGYGDRSIALLRTVAWSGLWWNFIWGEWSQFDFAYIVFGWFMNALVLGPLAVLFLGPWVGYLIPAAVVAALIPSLFLWSKAAAKRERLRHEERLQGLPPEVRQLIEETGDSERES